MARTLTTAQSTTYKKQSRAVHTRVKVANSAGVLVDHSDAMVPGGYVESTVDEQIDKAEIYFERGKGASSYAPLMTADPPITIGRELTFEVAVTDIGVAPVAGDWHELLRGPVVSWDDPTQNPMKVVAHDQGHYLQAKIIEDEVAYGNDEGTEELPAVMQKVITDNVPGVTLHTPIDPAAFVTTHKVEPGAEVLQILRGLAEARGWTVRYRWRASTSKSELTLYEPPRNKTVADWTMSPSRYLDVREIKADVEDVRNRIRVRYEDADGVRQTVTSENSASITKYGGPNVVPRSMLIDEPRDSPIKTAVQAQYLADACISDVSEPDITHAVEDFCLPHIEVGDLIAFDPNSVHYSTTQKLGVMSVRHEFPKPGVGRTILGCRGKPSGGVLMWRRKAKPPTRPLYQDQPATLLLQNLRARDSADGLSEVISWSNGAKLEEVWSSVQTFATPVDSDAWELVAASVEPMSPLLSTSLTVTKPTETDGTGRVTLVQIEGRFADSATGELVVGQVWRREIKPQSVVPDGAITETKISDDSISTPKLRANSVTAAKMSVMELSAIVADLGTIISGLMQNAATDPTAAIRLASTDTLPTTATTYLDLAASGAGAVLKHNELALNADGTANWSNTVQPPRLNNAHADGHWNGTGTDYSVTWENNSKVSTDHRIEIQFYRAGALVGSTNGIAHDAVQPYTKTISGGASSDTVSVIVALYEATGSKTISSIATREMIQTL